MNRPINLSIDVLQAAMAAAHHAILHGPDPAGDENDELVADLCSLLGALDSLLDRYRKGLTIAYDDIPF